MCPVDKLLRGYAFFSGAYHNRGAVGVIGAKIAAKVLHDGDLVEVDANRGIIRLV